MLRRGVQVLTIWCVLNGLPGVFSIGMLLAGQHAPGLRMRFQPDEISGIEPRALATVDGLASIVNPLIAVYCMTLLMLVRRSIARGERWAWWTMAAGTIVVQVAGYVADCAYFDCQNFVALHFSSALLIAGLALSARGPRGASLAPSS